MVGWTVGDILARADDWMDEWSCSFWCGGRLGRAKIKKTLPLQACCTNKKYLYVCAHSRTPTGNELCSCKRKQKNSEKKFTRNNQIVGSSRTAAARGVKKLLYLSIQPTFFLFRPPQKDFAYLESAKLVERKGRLRPFSYKYSSRIPLPSKLLLRQYRISQLSTHTSRALGTQKPLPTDPFDELHIL